MPNQTFEIIIIGGSFAGLSAAMTLGRSLRKVLIIDSGTPCNKSAPRAHNIIALDGKPPGAIITSAKAQVLQYPTVMFLEDTAVDVTGEDGNLHVVTGSGRHFTAEKILLATGLTDIFPDIPGFSDCWGKSILHCPYCHGYEVKNEHTAILANGEAAYHTGILIDNWTKKITVLTNGVSELRHEERQKLEQLGIDIVEKEISAIFHTDGNMERIGFTDGSAFTVKVMYASIPFAQQSELAEKLGCRLEHGHIIIDEEQQTTIPGVYAAGDNTAQHRAISVAAASGTKAGFAINASLFK